MQTVKRTLQPIAKVVCYGLLSFFAYAFIGAIVLVFHGCGAKPETVYIEKPEPYAVPTKCNLTLPAKSVPSGSVTVDVANASVDADIARDVARKCGAIDEQ